MPAPKKNTKKPTGEVLKRSQSLQAKKRVGKIIIFLVIVILLVSGLGYLLYLPALSIRSISVQGNDIIDDDDIIRVVNEGLEGRYWYIFPKNSIFIYPDKQITANLLERFPRMFKVEVGSGEWDSLVVDVVERDSESIWCRDDILAGEPISAVASSSESISAQAETKGGECYFADPQGKIFAPAPYFSNSVFVELAGFLAGDAIGQMPLSEQSYVIITHFAKGLSKVFNKTENDQYRLLKVKIVDKNTYEAILADTSKVSDNEWKIIFDSDESAEDLANNLITVLNSDPFKKEMQNNDEALASIDLRFNKKVYYKFKK